MSTQVLFREYRFSLATVSALTSKTAELAMRGPAGANAWKRGFRTGEWFAEQARRATLGSTSV